ACRWRGASLEICWSLYPMRQSNTALRATITTGCRGLRPGSRYASCLCLLRRRHLRGRRLLLLIEQVEDAARLDHAGVGVDVGLRRIRNELQVALLRLEHRDVLEERGPDLLDQHLGRLWIADVEVVRLAPEIMARGLRFRRDGVEIPHADAAHAFPFGRAGAGRRGADVAAHERPRRAIDGLPTIPP